MTNLYHRIIFTLTADFIFDNITLEKNITYLHRNLGLIIERIFMKYQFDKFPILCLKLNLAEAIFGFMKNLTRQLLSSRDHMQVLWRQQ